VNTVFEFVEAVFNEPSGPFYLDRVRNVTWGWHAVPDRTTEGITVINALRFEAFVETLSRLTLCHFEYADPAPVGWLRIEVAESASGQPSRRPGRLRGATAETSELRYDGLATVPGPGHIFRLRFVGTSPVVTVGNSRNAP
jgi:hypothetical protein